MKIFLSQMVAKKTVLKKNVGLPMEIDLNRLADNATIIISDPENNGSKLREIMNIYLKSKNIIILQSLCKIFINIVPLYKIRVHSDSIKHRNQSLQVIDFDKTLLQTYNLFIKELCKIDSTLSYRIACELLKNIDHFNFTDRIIAKVLIGSNRSESSEFCLETLADKLIHDSIGETVFLIIDKCLDCKFNYRLVEAINTSVYLEKCVQIRKDKVEYYEKEKIAQRKMEKKEKKGKGIFAKNYFKDKKNKKEEKKALKLSKEIKEQERKELGLIDDKNYIRTANALQRLYFTIFKEKNLKCFNSTYIGIRKYINLIRAEFREGLYALLNESIKFEATSLIASPTSSLEISKVFSGASISSCLQGMYSVLEIYRFSGYDYKRIIDIFYIIMDPFNQNVQITDYSMIYDVGKLLFVDNVQSKLRIIALMQRLMICRVVRYSEVLPRLIKDLEVKYDIELKDHEINNRKVCTSIIYDIDNVPNKPFYEYFLYKTSK